MRRCCPAPGRAVDGCWGARRESQPKKDLQRGCRAGPAACQQPLLLEHGPRLSLNWGGDVTPPQRGNAGCWRGMLRSAGWAPLAKWRERDGVFSSLCSRQGAVRRMLQAALAVYEPGVGSRVSSVAALPGRWDVGACTVSSAGSGAPRGPRVGRGVLGAGRMRGKG